jgi:hypothetical protein
MRVRLLALGLLLVACGGKSLDTGYDDARFDSFDPAMPVDMAAVRYRCAAGGGVDIPYTTDAAARAILAGRWFLCEKDSSEESQYIPAAMEFTVEGATFLLVPNDAGVYARDPRPGTYTTAKVLSCCYPDTWVIKLGGVGGVLGYYVNLRASPRQMLWASDTSHGGEPRPTVARWVKG